MVTGVTGWLSWMPVSQRVKIYLAAYAQGLGASGLTFYDDQVSGFFSPHAAGKSVMFLVALGKRARRRLVTLDTSRLRQQPNL